MCVVGQGAVVRRMQTGTAAATGKTNSRTTRNRDAEEAPL
jgi:hypothetical protein